MRKITREDCSNASASQIYLSFTPHELATTQFPMSKLKPGPNAIPEPTIILPAGKPNFTLNPKDVYL